MKIKSAFFFLIILYADYPLFSSSENCNSFFTKLSFAALKQATQKVVYDSQYYVIPYPKGDIPSNRGVCSDVIIRCYRTLNIDLQELVYKDMKKNFHLYPKLWGLKKPDPNIDHRRVPNLEVFFSRNGESLPLSEKGEDYHPGDIVTWDINCPFLTNHNQKKVIPHIGIVTHLQTNDKKRPLIVHNIGNGNQIEDILFNYKIRGHYKFKK